MSNQNQNYKKKGQNPPSSNNQPNQQQQNVAFAPKQNPADKAPFFGKSLQKFDERYNFGIEAQTALEVKFAHLKVGNRFHSSKDTDHKHPYGAFARKHFNRAILDGLTNRKVIDIGGHAIRTGTGKRWITDSYTPTYETVHSMLPLVSGVDELRHKSWRHKLEMRQDLSYVAKPPADLHIIPNACASRAGGAGLCSCPNLPRKEMDVISIDSAYYPGVITGMMQHLREFPNRRGYLAFHDYKRALDSGSLHYYTQDKEAEIRIRLSATEIKVWSKVQDNSTAYEHNIIDTGDGETWGIYEKPLNGGASSNLLDTSVVEIPGVSYIFQRIDNFNFKGHDYILVEVDCVEGKLDNIKYVDDIFLKPKLEIPKRHTALSTVRNVWHSVFKVSIKERKLFGKDLPTLLTAQVENFVRIHEPQEDLHMFNSILRWMANTPGGPINMEYNEDTHLYRVTTSVAFRNGLNIWCTRGLHYNTVVYENVSLPLFLEAFTKLIYRPEQSTVVQVTKSLTYTWTDNKTSFDVISSSIDLAILVAARENIRSMERNSNYDVFKSKTLAKADLTTTHDFFSSQRPSLIHYLMKLLISLISNDFVQGLIAFSMISILLGVYIVKPLYAVFIKTVGAYAQPGAIEDVQENWMNIWLCLSVMYTMRFLLRKRPKESNDSRPAELISSCVTIKDRLDISKNTGRVDPKWKFRDHDWNITGMDGETAAGKLGCSHHLKPLALQIGPQFHGAVRRTPTIKHSCKQCTMAASIRACSNWVTPDDRIMEDWEDHLQNMADDARAWIVAEGGLDVALSSWLAKHPEAYRDKMMKIVTSPEYMVKTSKVYDSFAKVEQQFTTVPEQFKETEKNKVKERQICSTKMDTISAGAYNNTVTTAPLFHALEGLFDRWCKPYCGRKNWEEICVDLDAAAARFKDPVWFSADASGFDMTQVKVLQQAFTAFITTIIINNILINWDVALDPISILECLKASEILVVSVGRGAAVYTTEGRASGDSWTTFGNTVLNISYWTFAFKAYGFNPHGDGVRFGYMPFLLKIKGDDVLFCVERGHVYLAEAAMRRYFASENKRNAKGFIVVKTWKKGRLDEMDFLSCQFIQLADGSHIMTRIPARVFQTMAFSTKIPGCLSNRDWHDLAPQLAYAKGQCLLSWARDFPIFDKLGKLYMNIGCKPDMKTITDYNQYTDEMRVSTRKLTTTDIDCIRAWLFDTYGVTASDIEELEHIMDCAGPYDVISHPVIEKFYTPLLDESLEATFAC